MLSWSITFLIVGLIAGLLGLSGIAGAATQIAWILFVVFLVLFLVSLVMGRRPPTDLGANPKGSIIFIDLCPGRPQGTSDAPSSEKFFVECYCLSA